MSVAQVLLSPLVWVVALVAAQRMAELVLARRNTARLLARGGRELGRGHYPLFIALHASWLLAILLTTPADRRPIWALLAVFAGLQMARIWVISTLGPYWTTRVITLDDAPIVGNGPFRFVRHPNYWVVIGEIAVLPLAFGDWGIALLWSVLNALLLRHRIKVEMTGLALRGPARRFKRPAVRAP